ncbi:hypothetical protein HOLleu_26119 [Holothuria leucospilota]|uniref:CCHC-type domain-containing protein n=1 Tax=Holothuria leucospilota TaxID=206669 RepID=A0A9Q1H403_HOLLE|nr:hypothetical protein HOLleu_26119 [Holothuria leucospilota]
MSRYLYSEKLEEKLDQGSEVLTEVKAKLRGFNLDTVGSSTQEPTPQVQTAATVSSSRKTGENNNWGNLPWKKDFKIAGQIGEPGQKDRLSFASLARQIEAGVKKGFSHDDVTEAVIKAIVPGSRLRNYLEGRTTISLPELRSLLRAHFQEKEATTLFQELSTAFQGPKETAHSFVLRTLDLRQKVVFASQEAGAGVIYTYDQAQKMFLHTVSTGLQSDYVRQQLQPLLTQEGTTDEALLEALTVFVGQEAERAMKLKKSKVCQIKSDIKEIPHNERPKSTKPDASQASGTNWEEMQSSIKEIIRAEISALQQKPSSDGKQRRPPQEWGCRNCRQSGQGRSCNHCFKCGSEEHFQRGCKQGRRNQENERGSLERDIV